jgi:hypothetical protein
MNDDLLERATRALRDTYVAECTPRGPLGERRLEGALRRSARRSRVPIVAALLAASLAGAGAWAGVTGRLPRWLVGHPHAAPHATEPVIVAPRVPERATVEEPVLVPSSQPVVPSTAVPVPTPSLPTASVPRARPEAAPEAAAAHEPPDLDALYEAAHRAHFTRRDPAAALAGWDRYLEAAGPRGRMAPEARYNRATALIRLGRNDEARAALEPFARGEYGGYRQNDALRLLESLR